MSAWIDPMTGIATAGDCCTAAADFEVRPDALSVARYTRLAVDRGAGLPQLVTELSMLLSAAVRAFNDLAEFADAANDRPEMAAHYWPALFTLCMAHQLCGAMVERAHSDGAAVEGGAP